MIFCCDSSFMNLVVQDNNYRLDISNINNTCLMTIDMPKDFPGMSRDLFTSKSEGGGKNTEESQRDAMLECLSDLLTEESDKSKDLIDPDYLSRSRPREKNSENAVNSSTSGNPTYFIDFKSDAVEKTTGDVYYSIFSSSSDSPTNSPAPSHLPYSTPLVRKKNSSPQKELFSLRQKFHNLSLRIFSEDCDEEECLKPSSPSLEIDEESDKSDNKPNSIENSANNDDVGDESDSFEALMARLRVSPPAPVNKPEPVHGDFSFVVSDSVLSEAESSNDFTFYHRLENQILQKSIERVKKVRRRVRVVSSSSESNTEQQVREEEEEVTEITRADTSENEELDYRSEIDEISPPLLLLSHQEEGLQHPKAAIRYRLKEARNEMQEDDVYSTLPFIYSLDSLEKTSSSKSCRRRHPSAERFVKNFKKNREELANRLYAFYNDIVFDNRLPKDLKVQWNERLLKTAGQCIYMRRKVKNPDGTFTVFISL
ncbi:unnamed protein product [Hymenolepis diminuta]|uniref:SprT-like domain-containing protein n=1 Tax=Hymenolepis diminuta TaxID=6216 RepID=A0A564Y0S9_HYMDI|nr:unnamed protein product [Hymenolepis diminuta]